MSKIYITFIFIGLILVTGLVPYLFPVTVATAVFMGWQRKRSINKFPIKTPAHYKITDPNEMDFNGKPLKAKGIYYLGKEKISNKEIWLSRNDMRQHMLVLGNTGSGKTSFLIGLATHNITLGGGLLFLDGSGHPQLYNQISEICRQAGRLQDLVVLNFMTNSNSTLSAIQSNSFNLFATGTSGCLSQLIIDLLDDVGGDGAMWKGRAVAMFSAVMKCLVFLRDTGEVQLNVDTLREFMNLNKIMQLANPKEYLTLPNEARNSVRAYLTSLPGFVESKGVNQSQTTLDQHGYLEMQFVRILSLLSDVYGYIFNKTSDFSMQDFVDNKRILLIILPALEKSGYEISNLGKIIVGCLKNMMASRLGSNLTGDWNELIEKRPLLNDPIPFLCIFDECGYYAVNGMAIMSAQARGLGFSMVYASQDIPTMQRNNEKEAASIIANTNTKIFMRTDNDGFSNILTNDSKIIYKGNAISFTPFYPFAGYTTNNQITGGINNLIKPLWKDEESINLFHYP